MSAKLPAPLRRFVRVYDNACRALAEARRVDEVKHILDVVAAVREYARRANNFELEGNAIALRMDAALRLGEMIAAQKATVGLATGGGGKYGRKRVLEKPTLKDAGIGKTLAHQARVLSQLSPADYERKREDARRSAGRVFRRVVRESEIEQERADRRKQTAQGGTVADLHALIASGFRAGVIAIDPPWPFEGWGERANRRTTDHYETMTIEEITALPIKTLAAEHCAVFVWGIWPYMPIWHDVLAAWDLTYSGLAFDWVKLNADGEGLHWGTGYGTRANPEPCILAKVGSPLRLDEGVHSVIMTPVGAHSEKPDEAYRRMRRLFGGPYLELFARKERDGWQTWGNEIARAQFGEAAE